MPTYLAYMGARAESSRVLAGNALLFVLGFSTTFIALGAGAGLLGANLQAAKPVLAPIAGVALIVMGLALFGVVPWLMMEGRFQFAHRLPKTPWASFIVGLTFAVGWTPCVGPILTAILILAGSKATAVQGAALLAAYSAGFAVPFLAGAFFVRPLTGALARWRHASRAINAVGATLLIVMGVLVLTNRLTLLNGVLPYLSPPAAAGTVFVPAGSLPTTAGSITVGRPAPDLTLVDIDGNRLHLADLKGRPVIINFWATWCTPCRDELPLLTATYQAHRDQGLMVVAIDFKESAQPVRDFTMRYGVVPAPFLDPDGRAANLYGVGLKSTGIPFSVFVARDGTVHAVVPGALYPDLLSLDLGQIL